MTSEEMQRTMEFIIEQQAKFATDIQKLSESDKELREADERLRESQATLTAAVIRIAEIVEGTEKIAAERFRKTDELFAELAEAQKATDERLNVLINVVEKQLTTRRNGKKRRK